VDPVVFGDEYRDEVQVFMEHWHLDNSNARAVQYCSVVGKFNFNYTYRTYCLLKTISTEVVLKVQYVLVRRLPASLPASSGHGKQRVATIIDQWMVVGWSSFKNDPERSR
jgi:hypothetical protein